MHPYDFDMEPTLDLESLGRIAGVSINVELDADADYEVIIENALKPAREKYGIHFPGEEPNILRNYEGQYIGASMLVEKGTILKEENQDFKAFIARCSSTEHVCMVEGQSPMITENKLSSFDDCFVAGAAN